MKHLKIKAIALAMSLTLLASCGGGGGSENKRKDDPIVNVSISIIPNNAKAPYGITTTIPVLANNTDIEVTAPSGSGCARRDSKNIACNPTLAGEYTVTATAVADRSKTASVTVTVPEAEIESEGLSIDSDGKYELELSADETGSAPITLYAADEWTAEVGAGEDGEIPDWIDIEDVSDISGSSIVVIQAEGSAGSKISGSAGIVKIAVTLEPNYSGQERRATIIITVGDDSVEITVIQSPTTEDGTNLGDEVSINISPSKAEGMTGDQKTFTVTMENSDDFTLSVIPASGHGCVKSGGNVVCTPTVAGTYEITVTAEADKTKTAAATFTAVTAAPKEVKIGISPEDAGDVDLNSSVDFTVTAENTDFSFDVSPETGHGCERDGNEITCTPTVADIYEITVTAEEDDAKTASATFVAVAVILEELNIEGTEMVRVEAGTFTMGCTWIQGAPFPLSYGYIEGFADEPSQGPGSGRCPMFARPAHDVTLTKDFYIGKYEVTQAEWEAVMETNPSPAENRDDKRKPVTNISWYDALDFIAALNERDAGKGWEWRLPTEAQWEYAAHGGHKPSRCADPAYINTLPINNYSWTTRTCLFNGANSASGVWFNTEYPSPMHSVDALAPESMLDGQLMALNELGLYHMSGNASEWVWDYSDTYDEDTPDDYAGPDSGSYGAENYHIIRGGSHLSNIDEATSFSRTGWAADNIKPDLGFRLALIMTGGE